MADLRSKYGFNGLDLTELRAIYYVLPQLWDHTIESRRFDQHVYSQEENAVCVPAEHESADQQTVTLAPKRAWKQGFKDKLEEFSVKADRGLLADYDVRNFVYRVRLFLLCVWVCAREDHSVGV